MTISRNSECDIDHGNDPGLNALETPLEFDRCQAQIAATVVLSFEGVDYIYHFCGPQCIAAWCKATSQYDG